MSLVEERFKASNQYGAALLATVVYRNHPLQGSIRRVDGKLEVGLPSFAEYSPVPDMLYNRLLSRKIAAMGQDANSPTIQQLLEEGETDIARTLSMSEAKRSDVSKNKLDSDDYKTDFEKQANIDAELMYGDARMREAIELCIPVLETYGVGEGEVTIQPLQLRTRIETVLEDVKVRRGGLPHSRMLSFANALFNRGEIA